MCNFAVLTKVLGVTEVLCGSIWHRLATRNYIQDLRQARMVFSATKSAKQKKTGEAGGLDGQAQTSSFHLRDHSTTVQLLGMLMCD